MSASAWRDPRSRSKARAHRIHNGLWVKANMTVSCNALHFVSAVVGLSQFNISE